MKSLDEYRKELEQDPKTRRRLRKLEKEFESVEASLTEEELVKYGLKPADPEDGADDKTQDDASETAKKDTAKNAASSVIDVLTHKI